MKPKAWRCACGETGEGDVRDLRRHQDTHDPIFPIGVEDNQEKTCSTCGVIYASGHKCDSVKLRMDLLSISALEGLADVLTYGAAKYNDRNWERGMNFSRVYAAVLRHLFAWWKGEDIDSESGLSHVDHALCGVMILSHYSANSFGAWDDRPEILP